MPRSESEIGHQIANWSDSRVRQFVVWLFVCYRFDLADIRTFQKKVR